MTVPSSLGSTDGVPVDVEAGEPGGTENARLRAQLRRAEARAERAERALERMERSAKYTIGSLLAEAARSPRRLLLLPRDLWRVWRLRRSRRRAPADVRATTRTRETSDLEAARLLLPRRAVRRDASFSIVGALSESTAAAWSPYAAVTSTLPHDGADLVAATGADLVIIESAAALPGGPWAFLGDPAAVDRQLAALRMIDAARAAGIPVAFLRSTPPAHSAHLDALARQCDLVVDGPGSRAHNPWNPGIDPAAWLTGLSGHDDRAALLLNDPFRDTRVPLLGGALTPSLARALDAAGITVVTPDPRLPVVPAQRAAVAEAALGIATPLMVTDDTVGAASSSLVVLASGRRLLGGADSDLDLLLPDAPWAHVVIDWAADPAMAIDAARVPLTAHERFVLLRDLVLHASAPVALQRLAELAGIPGRPAACWDIAIFAHDPDIDDVLRQSWRPREVLSAESLSDRAVDTLADHDISVVLAGGTRNELSLAAGAPLVASQVDLTDRHAIADLLVEHVAGMPPRARHSDAVLWSTR